MFKKPLSNVKTYAPIRSSDQRKIKQHVKHTFGIESSKIGNLLVPDGLVSQKVITHSNVSCIVYLSCEGDPLWFTIGKDVDGLIPTVYTLWKLYDLLPCISTSAAITSTIVKGSDLMIPDAVHVSSSTVPRQQLVSVVSHTAGPSSTCGPPLAVGRLAVELNTLKAGANGTAVHILHTWKDHLFGMGNKACPPLEIGVVVPDNERNGTASSVLRPIHKLPASSSVPKALSSTLSKFAFSKEEAVSDILRIAVLQAIATTLKPPASVYFPIPASAFYALRILPSRPALFRRPLFNVPDAMVSYPHIDIKHSSHKSLPAFFKALHKQGILTLGKDMEPEPLVMSVSVTHPDVVAHEPYTSLYNILTKKEEVPETRELYLPFQDAWLDEEERSETRGIEVKVLWKPYATNASARFFLEGGFNSKGRYSYPDVKLVVDRYVTMRRLRKPQDPSIVNVGKDKVLLSAVCTKCKVSNSRKFLKQEDVVWRLLEKMQKWYEIRAEGEDPVLRKGRLRPISIVVEVRQGKSITTVVKGFESFFLEGEEMAGELGRICACAAFVSPVPRTVSKSEVVVQGNRIKIVTEFLLSSGVPEKWIKSSGLKDKYLHSNADSALPPWQEHKRAHRKRQRVAIKKLVGVGSQMDDFVQQSVNTT